MNKIITSFIISIYSVMAMFAVTQADINLLKEAENSTYFNDTDFSAEYTIVQSKPGQGNSATYAVLYRRDRADTYTIVITGPSDDDKGKGYVQFDSTIWFYDPADNCYTFKNAKDKVEGTNATPADFTPQFYSRDYNIESTTSSKLGKFNCTLFTLKAKTNYVSYPEVKLWVTTEDGLIRMKKDYSLSGQLLRTTAMPSYQKIGSKDIPVSILIIDNLRGKKINNQMEYEKTQISIKNVSFNDLKDVIFTKAYLEMINK